MAIYLGLIAGAVLICVLPTFRTGFVVAEPEKLVDEKTKINVAKAAGETKQGESLTYTGHVVDKLTGKPIAGAIVTVRRSILTASEHSVLEEPQYKIDAAGRYTFTIPPRQVAERYLYIEVDVSHPDYVSPRIRIRPGHGPQE